jgi:hypothetical protein
MRTVRYDGGGRCQRHQRHARDCQCAVDPCEQARHFRAGQQLPLGRVQQPRDEGSQQAGPEFALRGRAQDDRACKLARKQIHPTPHLALAVGPRAKHSQHEHLEGLYQQLCVQRQPPTDRREYQQSNTDACGVWWFSGRVSESVVASNRQWAARAHAPTAGFQSATHIPAHLLEGPRSGAPAVPAHSLTAETHCTPRLAGRFHGAAPARRTPPC